MKLFALFCSLFLSLAVFGQVEEFDINNLVFSQSQGQSLFSEGTNNFSVTDKNSNAPLIFNAQIWLGGKGPNGELSIFFDTFNSSGNLSAGQINGTNPKSIFKVTKAEIDNHKINFAQSGYTMPAGIKDWPTQSSTYLGEKVEMAPYVDVDNNGVYNPSGGDYPNIIGDQVIYMIINDESSETSIKAEIHYMIYGFQGMGNDYLSNSFFVSARIHNRGTTLLSEAAMGMWADFDLGDPRDDYMGTDTIARVLYAYNANNQDQSGGGNIGFGENPPAVGLKSVCLPMNRSHVYINGLGAIGNPNNAIGHYGYLTGRWLDGTDVVRGGLGHEASTSSREKTRYLFDGNPLANTGWHEKGEGLAGDDKKGLLINRTNETDTYGIGYDQTFTYIFGKSPQNNSTNLESIPELIASLDSAEQFLINNYKNHPFLGNSLRCEEVGVGIKEHSSFAVALYPNPSSDVINLSSDKKLSQLTVISASGQVVLNQELSGQNTRIDISSFDEGIYLVNLVSEDGSQANRRFVVE